MKRPLAAFALGLGLLAAAPAAPAAAGVMPPNQMAHASTATLTASGASGDSAVVMSIRNESNANLRLVSITGFLAQSSMLFSDPSLFGTTKMHPLTMITIAPKHTLQLGYRGNGAMFAGLNGHLRRGEVTELVVRLQQASGRYETLYVKATVIAAPAHLHFLM